MKINWNDVTSVYGDKILNVFFFVHCMKNDVVHQLSVKDYPEAIRWLKDNAVLMDSYKAAMYTDMMKASK